MKLLLVLGLVPLYSALPFLSQDLGTETRTLTDALSNSLIALSSEPRAFKAIDRIFHQNNTCLRNIGEVIEAIQETTKLVESASGDVDSLSQKVNRLSELSGEAEVVGAVADILRSLEPVLEKLSPVIPISRSCATSTDNTMAYLRSLAVIMHELSYDPEVSQSQGTRNMFHKSGNILSGVSAFIENLKTQSEELQNFCFPSKDSTTKGIKALGEIMGSLADMFSSLGDYKAGEQIRQGKFMAQKIVDQVPRMNDLDIGFADCSNNDLESAASTLEDLAKIIEEIGMEKLLNDLGLDVSFLDYLKGQ
jgi:hypothetical protein